MFTFLSLLLDVADGLVARMLKVNSTLGIQLDSLADMVSFGLLPGAVMYAMLNQTVGQDLMLNTSLPKFWVPFAGFIITLFSALRLAKFNLDTRQHDGFLGLPTPSVTVFVVGLLQIYLWSPAVRPLVMNEAVLIGISLVLSYLLICELPMFSFKFSNFEWKGNEERFAGLALGIGSLLLFQWMAFAPIITLYVVYSAGKYFLKR